MLKKFFMGILLFTILIHNITSYDSLYGTYIKSIKTKNYKGEEITFPDEKLVTTVLFFDMGNKYHNNIISQFNHLLINLKLQDIRFNLICVSNGKIEDFQKLIDRLHLQAQLVNDQNNKISDIFNISCNSCFHLFIIDNSLILRYFSSKYDPIFVREILERYIKE